MSPPHGRMDQKAADILNGSKQILKRYAIPTLILGTAIVLPYSSKQELQEELVFQEPRVTLEGVVIVEQYTAYIDKESKYRMGIQIGERTCYVNVISTPTASKEAIDEEINIGMRVIIGPVQPPLEEVCKFSVNAQNIAPMDIRTEDKTVTGSAMDVQIKTITTWREYNYGMGEWEYDG